MSTSWVKQGRLWDPDGGDGWMSSHAALPALDAIDGDQYFLYFSSRDQDGRARIGRALVRLHGGTISVEEIEPESVLGLGDLGTFSDRGVTNSWIVADGARRLLYYTGWSLGVTVPFYLGAGLAISDDDGNTFAPVSAAPLLERIAVDAYLTASPCVIRTGERFQMWYVSGTAWEQREEGPRHSYHIKYADSEDGVVWDRRGIVCIDYRDESEFAISRPCVVLSEGIYRMWFSSRGDTYRLGYAESANGIDWERDDDAAGLELGEDGWDAEMIAYPLVYSHAGIDYMLYNGNDYGRTGIGYAVREAT